MLKYWQKYFTFNIIVTVLLQLLFMKVFFLNLQKYRTTAEVHEDCTELLPLVCRHSHDCMNRCHDTSVSDRSYTGASLFPMNFTCSLLNRRLLDLFIYIYLQFSNVLFGAIALSDIFFSPEMGQYICPPFFMVS